MLSLNDILVLLNLEDTPEDKLKDILESISGTYPFFFLPKLALLILYKEKGDEVYENQIYKTAIYSTNRSYLKFLVENIEIKTRESEIAPSENEICETVITEKIPLANTSLQEIDSERKDNNPVKEQQETEKPIEIVEILKTKEESLVEGNSEEIKNKLPDEDMLLSEIETVEPSVSSPADNQQVDWKKQLIDRFIEINPQISRPDPQKDFTEIPEPEERNAIKDDTLVSETLALVYTSQKHYSLAIDIYKKLCLKFPEKSSYFAKKIEELEKLNDKFKN